MRRQCTFCAAPIQECMGSVVAGDWLQFIADLILAEKIREVCPACALTRNPEELYGHPETNRLR
jgi:hypothetical protein